jgi:hypothetical protein
MSAERKKSPNERKGANRMRLPLILGLVIVGALLGGRWMQEMRLNHDMYRLASQEQALLADIEELKNDKRDLDVRLKGLVTRDVVLEALGKQGITMGQIDPSQEITITTPVATEAVGTDEGRE